MSEFSKQENLPEEERETEQSSEAHAEMPEDFDDPEGKSGKWKTVKGEVEVEGKKVEVSYREKVIDLPKHRQEETGIQRIRRRELLPPFPEGLVESERYATKEQYDDFYKFITDGNYPDPGTLVHIFEGQSAIPKYILKMKNEGLYFQNIKHRQDYSKYTELWFMSGEAWAPFKTPVFIFGNKNKEFVRYMKANMPTQDESDFYFVEENGVLVPKIKEGNDNTFRGQKKVFEVLLARKPIQKYKEFVVVLGKPLKWCHAECALVPTKKGLNVLFFETGDESKKEEKVNKIVK